MIRDFNITREMLEQHPTPENKLIISVLFGDNGEEDLKRAGFSLSDARNRMTAVTEAPEPDDRDEEIARLKDIIKAMGEQMEEILEVANDDADLIDLFKYEDQKRNEYLAELEVELAANMTKIKKLQDDVEFWKDKYIKIVDDCK